jgi:hypothetical protein
VLSGLVKQKAVLRDKKLRTQINGKCNDKISADENKEQNITVEPLFKTIKRQ